MSIDRIVAVSTAEKMASRSKIRKRGADSKGKVSRSCLATQAALLIGLVRKYPDMVARLAEV